MIRLPAQRSREPAKRPSESAGGRPNPDRTGTIPERLTYLFETVRGRNGEHHTPTQVASWITDNGGKISTVYIRKILSGERQTPGASYLKPIAQYFRVSPSFFYDDDPAPIDGLEQHLLILIRDTEYVSLLERYSTLSPELREIVSSVIDQLMRSVQPPTTE